MEVWENKGYMLEKRLLGILGGICYLGVQDGAAGAYGLVPLPSGDSGGRAMLTPDFGLLAKFLLF